MTPPDTPRPTSEGPDRGSAEDRRHRSRREERDAVRRQRRARVFGETLPDATRDERGEAWGEREDGGEPADEWLRRQVPPHHG